MPDDKKIIKEIRKGDVAAFSLLIDRYRHMVYTLAFQLMKNEADAEEVAQDAFLKAYRGLNKFEGRSAFSTWIYRITYHQALSKLRKIKGREIGYDDDKSGTSGNSSFDEMASDNIEKEDRKRFLKQALSKLKGEEATVLTLFYFEELRVEEISDITGLTVSNVKVKLHRGRQNLMSELNVLLRKETSSLL